MLRQFNEYFLWEWWTIKLAPVQSVALKVAFVKILLMSKEHMKDVSFSANVKDP